MRERETANEAFKVGCQEGAAGAGPLNKRYTPLQLPSLVPKKRRVMWVLLHESIVSLLPFRMR